MRRQQIMPIQFTSTIALLVGNLLPIVGVLLWNWDVRSIVTLYWSENLIIGGIMLLKMFYRGGPKSLPHVLFFLVHYGAFCAAHGIFISDFFAPEGAVDMGIGLDQQGPLGIFIAPVTTIFGEASSLWWWAFSALAISHLVSFFVNWIGQREHAAETRGSLMTAPYRRILVLHVTVLLGGIAVLELGSPVYLVVVLVLVKIGLDLLMHRREHSAKGRALHRGGDGSADVPVKDPRILSETQEY